MTRSKKKKKKKKKRRKTEEERKERVCLRAVLCMIVISSVLTFCLSFFQRAVAAGCVSEMEPKDMVSGLSSWLSVSEKKMEKKEEEEEKKKKKKKKNEGEV